MEDRSQELCIVGAGPVGLGMARAFAARGIAYAQLESDQGVGGNWRHGVYESAHIISSKRTTEYADFPMPESYPDFPSGAQMLAYLESFARTFNLLPRIEFGRTLQAARPLPDGRWELTLEDGTVRLHKGLVLCSGHHWDRRWPEIPGTFAGEYLHSKDYRSAEQLRGKRVLVIGAGNSACDVASEAARVGTSCDIALRRGHWFLPKTVFGMPVVEIMKPWLPVPAQRLLIKTLLKVMVGDYARYGLPRPTHRIFDEHPTLNGELLHYLKHGRIHPRTNVARFEGSAAIFEDGTRHTYDLVIAATGFHVSFPVLPEGLIAVKGSTPQLYGGVVLPDVKNLYVVGSSQPRFGFGPLVTPGARLVALLVELQDQMELPIGRVLQALGMELPQSHLVDPHAAIREMRLAQVVLPRVAPRLEKRLRKKLAIRAREAHR
jgi:hypothetical protein